MIIMKKIKINGIDHKYDVTISDKILSRKVSFLDKYNKICFVIDKNVKQDLYKSLFDDISNKDNVLINFTNGKIWFWKDCIIS